MAAKTKLETETEVEVMKKEMQMFQKANDEAHLDIKKDICEVKGSVDKLVDKLDQALEKKADKSEVDEIKGSLKWFATALITAFLGLLVYLFQGHIRF